MTQKQREIAEGSGLSFIEEVRAEQIDPALLAEIPVAWARERLVLPILHNGDPALLSASADCLPALQQAQLITGRELVPVLAETSVVAAAIERAFAQTGPGREHESAEKESVPPDYEPIDRLNETADLLTGGEAAPVTRTLSAILLEAVRKNASDIHFEPHPAGLRLRYRIDGGLYEQPPPPKAYSDALVSRVKVMARMDIAERRLPQDGMAETRVGDRRIDIRVSTVPITDGERVVMRLLDRDRAWRPLTELGMPATVLAPFEDLLALSHGLLIVSGPTGSGKTTTLYSALGTLDSARRNILTVEDPVEYRLSSIGQIQVKPKIGLTFAAGLRHILRQDPDVILVGETRDLETAEIAVRASLTGHLVFTTLHTNDAPSAVARLVDMGIEPFLLAACMRGVLAQRLVRKLCPLCRERVKISQTQEGVRRKLSEARRKLAEELGEDHHFEPRGCPQCLEGFAGRTGIFEMMPCPRELADAIAASGGDIKHLREVAAELQGYHPLRRDGLDKVREGVTSIDEVLTALSV